MLTAQRIQQIDELVEAWDRNEKLKEEYPENEAIIETILGNPHHSQEDPLLVRASQEIGVSIEELEQWYDCSNEVSDEERLIEADFTEEELRDLS